IGWGLGCGTARQVPRLRDRGVAGGHLGGVHPRGPVADLLRGGSRGAGPRRAGAALGPPPRPARAGEWGRYRPVGTPDPDPLLRRVPRPGDRPVAATGPGPRFLPRVLLGLPPGPRA